MKLKLKLIAAAAITSLACVSSHAADTDWMTHDPLESQLSFFAAGLVQDTFTFSLSAGYTYDVYSDFQSGGFLPGFAFYGLFAADDTPIAAYATNTGTQSVWSLDAGDYYYSVVGVSTSGGAYSLSSSIVATPVPEPESYVMMLAGLGAVGFMAARRRRAD